MCTTTTSTYLNPVSDEGPVVHHLFAVNPIMKARIDTYQTRKTVLIEQYFIKNPVRPTNQLEMFHQLQKETNDILEAICSGNCKEVGRELEELAVKSACMDIVKPFINKPYPSY